MPVVLIYILGGGVTGLILIAGWLWRWRRAIIATASAIVTAIVVAAVVVVVWPRALPQPPMATPASVPPTLKVISWGEDDGDTDAVSATNPTPAHIVVAHLQITAGNTALSIPALGTSNTANLLWLGVRGTGRSPLSSQARRTADGTLWLPSHSAHLVKDFGNAPLTFPDAGCADTPPGGRCEVTVVWDIAGHGAVPITSLVLLPADVDPSIVTPSAVTTWPPSNTAQSVCDGPAKAWCNT